MSLFHSSGCRRFLAVASLAAALVVIPGASGTARAGYVLGFSQAVYTANVNQIVNVPVYLTETDAANILNTQGLNGGGLVLSYNVTPRATSPAEVTLISTNPGTDPILDIVVSTNVPATPSTTGIATLKFSQLLDPPLSAGGTNRILVGTFQFMTGSVNPDVTNLSLGLRNPGQPVRHVDGFRPGLEHHQRDRPDRDRGS